MEAEVELVEDHVVDEALAARRVLRVNPVREATPAPAVKAVVVDDISIQFGIGGSRPHAKAAPAMIVDNHVDEPGARAEDVDPDYGHAIGIRVGHLKAPVPGVTAVDRHSPVDGRPFSWILTYDDRGARSAGQATGGRTGVGAPAQP